MCAQIILGLPKNAEGRVTEMIIDANKVMTSMIPDKLHLP